MKKNVLIYFLIMFHISVFSQTNQIETSAGYIPSNRSMSASLEKNILFNATTRYTVTHSGVGSYYSIPALFDGAFSPNYTNESITPSNTIEITIEGLPEDHTQTGAWIGFTTRYWAPKSFKIEGFNVFSGANTWVTLADVTDNYDFQYAKSIIPGVYTKLKFIFREGAPDSNPQYRIGLSELFFIHPEAAQAYDGLLMKMNGGDIKVPGKMNVAGSITLRNDSTFYVTNSNIPDLNTQNYSMPKYGFASPAASSTADLWMSGNNAIRMFTGSNSDPRLNILGNGNVGIGLINPTRILQISKSDATTNLSLSNTSALELWNPYTGTNSGSQINFRSDASTTNSGIGAVIGYLNKGSNSSGSVGDLVFAVKNSATETSVTPAMTIKLGGNVGIGTTTPNAKLEVAGKIRSYGDIYGSTVLTFQDDSRFPVTRTEVPSLNSTSFSMPQYGIAAPSVGGSADLWIAGNSGIRMFSGGSPIPKVNILSNGSVGIGTTKPTHLLSVNGTIRAKEVIVDLCSDLADYVFDADYELMPLVDVEQYVKTNKHLPEIPSATEVQKNGLSVGEMQNKLLQKIEELTLYVIEQQKQINELKKELKK